MNEVRADLRAYYEEEARLGLRNMLRGRRLRLRDEFLTLLRAEGRESLVDFGAGPGLDGAGFVAADLRFVGLDLAHGNALLAAENGVTVVQGSITAPPFRPASFDAGWSMSTLMHLPRAEVAGAVAAMALSLHPGSPLLVGVWGGELGDIIGDSTITGQRRLFSHRPLEQNHDLLAAGGAIERAETWEAGEDGWDYQIFLLRT
ncbi:MAG: class I SAM-dependent methyltransferase [Actinomycetia bacterium]|nr:class I SAM-dependent methyltransferase [Actinomycetes bacterium]